MCHGHSLLPAYHWPHVQAVSTPPSLPARVQLHHPVVTRPSPHRQTPGSGVSSSRHGDSTGGLEAVLCLGTMSGAQPCGQHQSSKSKAHLCRGKEIRRQRQPRNLGLWSDSPGRRITVTVFGPGWVGVQHGRPSHIPRLKPHAVSLQPGRRCCLAKPETLCPGLKSCISSSGMPASLQVSKFISRPPPASGSCALGEDMRKVKCQI